jgi:hypothetical protein
MTKFSKLFIALPVINEFDNMPKFIQNIELQTFKDFTLYVCVNQPDDWWHNETKKNICENNQLTIKYLENVNNLDIKIIDKSTKGKGWLGKQSGVGWARKTLMDEINLIAEANDIVVSIDADTVFNTKYFETIYNSIHAHTQSLAISVPYYHPLCNKEAENRAILRYEIYMRHYAINLWRIKSPYCFTALGSAIAFPIWAYRKIGGISPVKSGEDFYFLQKLCKTGEILNWNSEKVYPAARFSDRVFFGTGPAMIKGNTGDWNSYPIYHFSLFDNIYKTMEAFKLLFTEDIELVMSDFLNTQFNDDKWWLQLRKNFKTPQHFIKACNEKMDGLRCLQYLKITQPSLNKTDENCLFDFFTAFYPEAIHLLNLTDDFKFNELNIVKLDNIRNYLMQIEENYQKQDYLTKIKNAK